MRLRRLKVEQFNYSNPYTTYDPSAAFYLRRRYEKKELRMIGNCTGVGICSYILLSQIFAFLPEILGLTRIYYQKGSFFYSVTMLSTVICMLVPFLLVAWYMKKHLPVEVDFVPAKKPEKWSNFFLALPVGFGACLLSNFISAYIDILIESSGVGISSPDVDPGKSEPVYLLMYFVCVAVCSPLCEEIAMRGVLTQPLRRYGGAFAVGAVSVVFGLLHCNLVQAPCAIMCGIALGYLALVTESIWTSVIIHALNNSYSVFIGELQKTADERTVLVIHYAVTVIGIIAGIICFIILLIKRRGVGISGKDTYLTTREKITCYFVNVPMILALVFILYITKSYVSL